MQFIKEGNSTGRWLLCSSPVHSPSSSNPRRSVCELGGLWCLDEAGDSERLTFPLSNAVSLRYVFTTCKRRLHVTDLP